MNKLSIKPIKEMQVDTLHPRYFAAVESFMRLHQCTVSYMSRGHYLFLFPDGTEEIEQQNQPPGEYWSTIKLPDGLQLIKKVLLAQEEGGPSVLFLYLPGAAYGLKSGRKTHGRS